MNFVKIFLAALAGFALGAVLFHTPRVKASGIVHLRQLGVSTPVTDDQIIGFSCVNDSGKGGPECFLASK